MAGAGYTIVDIEDAIDYSPLEEWDHIGIMFKAVAEYRLKPGLFLVGEFGENRLYYWEYRWSDGYYSGTRWRSEWTTNIGLSFKKLVGAFYLQAGPAIHIFNDGSGTRQKKRLFSGNVPDYICKKCFRTRFYANEAGDFLNCLKLISWPVFSCQSRSDIVRMLRTNVTGLISSNIWFSLWQRSRL